MDSDIEINFDYLFQCKFLNINFQLPDLCLLLPFFFFKHIIKHSIKLTKTKQKFHLAE
jgi:hypothetical protein